MSTKRRREWKESLKQDIDDRHKNYPAKEQKIQILKDETYKNVDGKMIFVSTNQKNNNTVSTNNNNICNKTTPQPEVSNRNSLQNCKTNFQMSPHQLSEKIGIDSLTPTYRKPEKYLNETKEVMKGITPVKLFPVSSEMEIEEIFTILPHYDIEQDTENGRLFSNLNNYQPILTAYNEGENSLREPLCANNKDTEHNNSCSITVQIKVEHDNGLDNIENGNISELTRTVEVNNQKIIAKSKTSDEIKNYGNDISVNDETDYVKENKTADFIVKNYDEDKIEMFIPKDTAITENLPSCITSDKDVSTDTKKKSRVKRLRRNIEYDKSYFDYMSDDDVEQLLLDEAFPSEASSEEYYTEENSDFSNDEDKSDKKQKKQVKKKRKKVEKKVEKNTTNDHNISGQKNATKTAVRLENKKKKQKGEMYTNDKGKLIEGKSIKPNLCIGKLCGNDCGNIPEDRRQSLFSYFWNLNSNQRRKDWIAQCATKKSIKRPNKDNNIRSCSYDYYINEGEGRRKVCQKYLINTLNVSQRFILYTLETMTDGFAKNDERGINGGHNKTKEEVLEHARNFIESLPKMPSHYCRKDSKRLYFPEEFRNVSNLYRIYKNKCHETKRRAMSFQVFRDWFKKSYNIGFHVPKKDKCTICSSNKTNEKETETEKERFVKHVKEKSESYKRFKCHQNIHGKDKSTICASFDMQKVLNTPHGDSMMLYYSRKFAVFNFTIYESTTRKGYCNVWTETDAHRGATEICTCLYNYIKELDSCRSVKTLLLYCDSCYGQNKNKYVLSMIRYALSQCQSIKTIQINYLIPGHTYMPVDSVHATIETKIRKSTIWAPSQWPTIMEFARQDPEPYKVNVLKGKDFIGFDKIVESTFKKNQKISISKLNIVTFKKQALNVMFVKTSMLPDAETVNIPLLPLKNTVSLKRNLYPTQLGISAKKHKDLMNLVNKNIIPSRFGQEYKDLNINHKVNDTIVDTDEEDETEIQDDDGVGRVK